MSTPRAEPPPPARNLPSTHHGTSLPPPLALPPCTLLPWALPSAPSRRILPSSTGAISHRPVSGCFLAVRLMPSACSRACDFSAHRQARKKGRVKRWVAPSGEGRLGWWSGNGAYSSGRKMRAQSTR